jgi:hypothetical protein
MKTYVAYVRVSTMRPTKAASLSQQREAPWRSRRYAIDTANRNASEPSGKCRI